jgi:rod shape-determining protein MreC
MLHSGSNRENTLFEHIALALCVCVSVVLIGVYVHEGAGGMLHLAQGSVRAIVAPLTSVGESVGAGVDGVGQSVSDVAADAETLSALQQQNQELTNLLAQAEEYRQEAERLEALLELKDNYEATGVTGRVIGRSTDAWNQTITLDVGSSSGVEAGLTVMGSTGVVGQVIDVTEGTCTVRLLTDAQSGAAAMVQSSRAEGIVRGSLSGLLYLENIDADVKLSVGDVVITSGLGGSYVKGLLIGTIVRVEGNSVDGTRTVVVSPNESASPLEEAIVVFDISKSADTTSATMSSASSTSSTSSSSSSSNDEDDDELDGDE